MPLAIPRDFPLAAGTAYSTSQVSFQRGPGIDPGFSPWIEVVLTHCNRHLRWVSSNSSIAAVRVDGSADGEPVEDRTLATFSTVHAAKARLSAMKNLLSTCVAATPSPRSSRDGLGGNSGLFLESEAGDASYAFMTPHSDLLRLVVRVGTAILLEETTQTTVTPEQSIAAAEQRLVPVLSAMRMFE